MNTYFFKRFCISFLFFSLLPLQAKSVIKALLVTGGVAHDYNGQREIIPAAIDARSKVKIEWTIVYEPSKEGSYEMDFYKNPDWAKGYDVVVHNECFAKISNQEYIEGIIKPHSDGIPAVLIHGTMHCYREHAVASEKWWQFCGLHSPGHGPHHGFEVEILDNNHEIMKGMTNWHIPKDELYFVKKIYPTATPLAQSAEANEGAKRHVNIWVNLHGPKKTRVFATSIGHYNDTIKQSQYGDLITRGLLWAVGLPVSENIKQPAQ